MSNEPPTFDEMIFAVSQINFCTIHRKTSPPHPATNRLSTNLDNAAGSSLTGVLLTPYTGTTSIDDARENDSDEDDEDEDVDTLVDSRASSPVKKSKHLILLDLLALLLVGEDKSDVAATMLIMGREPKFYYCKNWPLTDDENRYVQKIFDCARDSTVSAADRMSALRIIVFGYCREKIKARVWKVMKWAEQLQKVVCYGISDETCLPSETLAKARLG